jgi:hypothetical protein
MRAAADVQVCAAMNSCEKNRSVNAMRKNSMYPLLWLKRLACVIEMY